MRRLLATTALAATIAILLPTARAAPAAAPACQFTFGFQALHDLMPDVVGNCLEDAHTEPATGNALQRTTGGLLVWRPSVNWLGFTNGNRTWINGPFGLQQRGSTERFDWEDALVPVPTPSTPTQPSPALAPAAPPPAPTATPAPAPAAAAQPAATCVPAPANDDVSRAIPLTDAADGVLPPAIWSPSGQQPDRIAYRYYSFTHSGDGSPVTLAVSAGDDGGWKVRVNVYAPDATLIGNLSVGANERQELQLRPDKPGGYVVQLWNYRPAEVPFRVELRRGF